jgi:hypothetical protein
MKLLIFLVVTLVLLPVILGSGDSAISAAYEEKTYYIQTMITCDYLITTKKDR